jgi:hypothetical protein
LTDDKSHGKTLAVITQPSDIGAMLRASEKYADLRFVATSKKLADQVEKQGRDCGLLHDYMEESENGELRKLAVEWIDSWSDGQVRQGGSLKETLCLEGASLWWFALPVLFPDVLRCIQHIEAFRAVVRSESPARVLLVDLRRRSNHPFRLNHDDNAPGKVIAAVCRADQVPVEFVAGGLLGALAWEKKRAGAEFKSFIYFTLGRRLIARVRRASIGRKRASSPTARRPSVLLLTSPLYWRESLDMEGGRVWDDGVAGLSVRALVDRGYRVVGIDAEINVPNWRQFSVLRAKARQQHIDWQCMEHYIARIPAAVKRARAKGIGEIYKRLMANGWAGPALEYGGVDLSAVIQHRFSYLFTRYLPQAVDYIGAIEVAVTSEKTDLMLCVYEEGPYGRAGTIVGHRMGIPTVALQHGMVAGPYNAGFYFSKVSTDVLRDGIACPIPTRTAVYGQHAKSLLTEISAYPEDSVQVVGMPSYDPVVRHLAKTSGNAPAEAPVALIVSQPFFNRDNRQFFIDMVLDGAALLPEIQWVVKLHPSDFGKAVDWAEAIETRALANVKVVKDNLYDWLAACDFMVAWASTTMLEAVIFGKPVLAVRVPGCQGADDYFGAKIAISVASSSDIVKLARHLLDKSGWGLTAVEESRRALEHIVYRPDGHAAARCADLVDELIEPRGDSAIAAQTLVRAPHSA